MSESKEPGAQERPAPEGGAADARARATKRRWLLRTAERLFRRSAVEGSLRIALFMVVVSLATGPMTYLATERAEIAAEASDRALEEAAEEGFLERSIQDAIDREEQRFATWVQHRSRYEAHVEASASDGATHHLFGAQAEWDQVLLAHSGFEWAYPTTDAADHWIYPRADAEEAIRVDTEAGRLLELEGSAAAARKQGAVHRSVVLVHVTLIAISIGSLLLLTIAQVTAGGRRRAFALAGVLVALGSFVGVAVVDKSLAAQATALLAAVAIGVVAAGDRLVRSLRRVLSRAVTVSESAELLDADSGAVGGARLGIHPANEVTTLFARLVAVAIAVGTATGAWIGYVQADAFGRADTARSVAQAQALDANIAAVGPTAHAFHELAAWDRAVEARFAVFAGEQVVGAGHASGDHQAMADAESELRHLEHTRDALEALVAFEALGPDEDEAFPDRLLAEASRQHDTATARQFIADADAREWTERGSLYVRLLVVLAVAVYLLGLAVVIEGQRVKMLFSAMGCLGVAIAALWTGWTILDKPDAAHADAESRAETAAAAYAEGRYQARLGNWPAAQEAFAAAVDRATARPEFGQALVHLADAEFLAGSPQRLGYTSVSIPDAVLQSLKHRMRAVELGYDSYANSVNLGYESLLASLQADDERRREDLLEQSTEASAAAILLLPGKPLPVFNLAVAELAAGETDSAAYFYENAINDTRDHPQKDALLRGAITDLEVVRHYRPELAAVVDARQAVLVATLAGEDAAPEEPFDAGMVEASWSATTLTWSAELSALGVDDRLVQVWYQRASSAQPWVVYAGPEVVDRSGEVTERGLVEFFDGDEDAPEESVESDFAGSFGECLPAGEYRVDVFVNGSLFGRSDPMEATSTMRAWWARELGIQACIPADWVRAPAEERHPGYSDGFAGPEGEGLVFVRVHDAGPGDPLERAQAVLARLRASGVAGVPAGLEPDAETLPSFFVGLPSDSEVTEVWRSPEREYRAQAGVTATGTVLVAILFGPTGFLEKDEASETPIGRSYVRMAEWWGLLPTVGTPE